MSSRLSNYALQRAGDKWRLKRKSDGFYKDLRSLNKYWWSEHCEFWPHTIGEIENIELYLGVKFKRKSRS
jgi:hypothetical protein